MLNENLCVGVLNIFSCFCKFYLFVVKVIFCNKVEEFLFFDEM